MLVLTRQVEEEIVIGETIRLKVLAINGGQVRIGITAPAEITILRGELYEAIARQNEIAAADALHVAAAWPQVERSPCAAPAALDKQRNSS